LSVQLYSWIAWCLPTNGVLKVPLTERELNAVLPKWFTV